MGYALHRLPAESAIPWHRVINGRGQISLEEGSLDWHRQRVLLQAEGVDFREGGKIPLNRYQWRAGKTPSRQRNRR